MKKVKEKYLDKDHMDEQKNYSTQNISVTREVRKLGMKLLKAPSVENKIHILGGLCILCCASNTGDEALKSLAIKVSMGDRN